MNDGNLFWNHILKPCLKPPMIFHLKLFGFAKWWRRRNYGVFRLFFFGIVKPLIRVLMQAHRHMCQQATKSIRSNGLWKQLCISGQIWSQHLRSHITCLILFYVRRRNTKRNRKTKCRMCFYVHMRICWFLGTFFRVLKHGETWVLRTKRSHSIHPICVNVYLFFWMPLIEFKPNNISKEVLGLQRVQYSQKYRSSIGLIQSNCKAGDVMLPMITSSQFDIHFGERLIANWLSVI